MTPVSGIAKVRRRLLASEEVPMPRYRAVTGLNYAPSGAKRGEEVRREAGDLVDDLSPTSVAAFLATGAIEEIPAARAPVLAGGDA